MNGICGAGLRPTVLIQALNNSFVDIPCFLLFIYSNSWFLRFVCFLLFSLIMHFPVAQPLSVCALLPWCGCLPRLMICVYPEFRRKE